MSIVQHKKLLDAQLANLTITNGSTIYTTDTGKHFIDISDTERVQITDIIYIDTDSARAALLAPLPDKLYIPRDTSKVWIYSATTDKWVCLNPSYSAGSGLSLSGTTFTNSGVRAVTAGTSANQIKVNTGGTSTTITVNNVANATSASKATNDSAGQQIDTTYIKGLSISGKVITYTKGDGTTGTITTQDNNTWRGIQNVLTSDSTTDSLSAAQGKALKTLVDGKADKATTLSGYGITDASISNGKITIGSNSITPLTSHQSLTAYAKTADVNTSLAKKADKATTLSGYGITDASISNGKITIGANSITPLTSHQSLANYYTKTNVDTLISNLKAGLVNVVESLPTTGENGKLYLVKTGTEDQNLYTEYVYVNSAWEKLGTQKLDLSGYLTKTDAASTYLGKSANAVSATKLTTSAGNATQPIYFSDGVPTACTYTLGASVPSGAKFTDTVYTLPDATASVKGGIKVGSNLTVSSGVLSLSKANVTAALGYTPPTTNTTYSNMTAATASAAGSAGLVPAPAAGKQTSFLRGDGTWVVPTNTTYSNMKAATADAAGSAGLVPAPAAGAQGLYLRGDGTWATPTNTTYNAATTSALGLIKVGSNLTISSGVLSLSKANVTAALGYTPPTANTDTHYTTGLKVGASASATANAAATNGNVYLNVLDNTTVRDSHNIVGSGATTVTSDANGKITISSTNTVYSHPSTHPASMITGLATVATSGKYSDLSGTPTLGSAASKGVLNITTKGTLSWADATTSGNAVPTVNTLAYWNGAYNNTNSNLAYCNQGAFGSIVTKSTSDYATASHTHTTVNGITPEYSGSVAYGDTSWIAAWSSDGKKIKALNKNSLAAGTNGIANSATKLATARTISLGTGIVGSATSFDGSANITIPVTTVKESYLGWGGKNFAGSFGCIDAAMVPDLGANRLAFGKAAGIKVEYSTDGGSTWVDYGLTDAQKVGLFGAGSSATIGKASASTLTTKCMLRVTVDTDAFGVYTTLNKFVIYLSTNGCSGTYCTIDAALEETPTTFKVFADKVSISGWSGYNVINISELVTYGNTKNSQYGLIRFTFGCTAVNTSYNGLTISRIMGFGGVGWSTPSNMAKYGHLYSYDNSQNASFPAQITATQFNGALSGTASKATSDSAGQNINTTYIKALSISGKVITYTKGNGTTGTITTQDTNTTYSAGTGLALSGTTFSNSGVRSVTAGSTANIISVNTGGTTTSITVNNVTNATTASTLSLSNGTDDAARFVVFQSSGNSTSTLTACYDTDFKYNPVSNVLTVGSVSSANVVKALSISGKTITVTKGDGTTSTLTTQDTNTTYGAASSSTLGLVKTGSNITNSSGTISITKDNVIAALGYTPPTQDTNTDTKVTNTLATTTKAYVTGTTSATTNTGTQVFDTGVYLDTTAGTLVATKFKTSTGIEIY